MRHLGLALTLVLHLLLFLAFQHWSRHSAALVAPRGEVAMLWMAPLKPVALQPSPARPPGSAASRPAPRSPTVANIAPQKSSAITIIAPTAAVADPVPVAETGRVLADPAALVRATHFDDDKSALRRSIEAHGGTLASAKKEKYAAFQDAVEAATVPDCVGGTNDEKKAGGGSAGGLFALPMLIGAKLTGHCK